MKMQKNLSTEPEEMNPCRCTMLQYGGRFDSPAEEQQAGSKKPQGRSREQAVLLERKIGGNIDIAEVKASCLYALHGSTSIRCHIIGCHKA